MAAYSFIDIVGSLIGPGISQSIGAGSGNAEGGIKIPRAEPKNTMTVGADGTGMHSLHAGNHGSISIELLKTAPLNQILSAAYNFQRSSSANWGRNSISVRDPARGDWWTCTQVAFEKVPDIAYAKDGDTLTWVFNAVQIDGALGSGAPEL
ncbi:DUF3277 family protein [Mesorhizobium sp. BR1-1-16]|uniref:phage protein n=1 Tax=Mesorhizobium sp. BR1-1-16 TaxID=2876653 RepID=UPI001CC93BBB|nr:phage protein [Mesorhizobium sp. BR1-1-16]MBZ9939137.1 DUF3277 family protein [Mesorhizobium sp. BR1-1-16]